MDAGDCAPSLTAFAAYTEDKLGHDMVEFAFGCELVDLDFDFWSRIILYRHMFPSLFPALI